MPADPKNLLPQSFGFKPGTSMIGSFGSTDTRFKGPKDALPGPGAYPSHVWNKALNVNSRGPHRNSQQWTWGTGAGHNLILAGGESPGPGAYGSGQNLDGDILTDLRRKWPGISTHSGFGSNAPTGRGSSLARFATEAPGPGQYNAEASTYFLSNAPMGTQTPFVAQARTTTGARLQRDVDIKVSSAFASKRPAHILSFDSSGAATSMPRDGPSPLDTHSSTNTIGSEHHARMARLSLRSDAGTRTSFDSTAQRFPESNATSAVSLGPGAHTVSRWTGETPNARRIRHAPPGSSAAKTGFLVSAERFAPPGDRGQRGAGDTVMQYLASSSAGPVGQPVHAQSALAQVTRAR